MTAEERYRTSIWTLKMRVEKWFEKKGYKLLGFEPTSAHAVQITALNPGYTRLLLSIEETSSPGSNSRGFWDSKSSDDYYEEQRVVSSIARACAFSDPANIESSFADRIPSKYEVTVSRVDPFTIEGYIVSPLVPEKFFYIFKAEPDAKMESTTHGIDWSRALGDYIDDEIKHAIDPIDAFSIEWKIQSMDRDGFTYFKVVATKHPSSSDYAHRIVDGGFAFRAPSMLLGGEILTALKAFLKTYFARIEFYGIEESQILFDGKLEVKKAELGFAEGRFTHNRHTFDWIIAGCALRPSVSNEWFDDFVDDSSAVSDLHNASMDDMNGHEFEIFCANLLRNNGFDDVEVTSGSGDQGIDIIAAKDFIKYGFQCKCYSSNIGNSAVQEALAGKAFYGCHVAVVLTNRYFTSSAIELAKQAGVVLWDRDKLLSMMG